MKENTGQPVDVLSSVVVDIQEVHQAIADRCVHKHVAMVVHALLQTNVLAPDSGQEHRVQHLFALFPVRMVEHVHHLTHVNAHRDGQVLDV
jgi:hypothetical protein